MFLRQAIALAPNHRRAHNNLALLLAHTGRDDQALAEFLRSGCRPAEAHVHLAYVLTLKRCLPQARRHYERALAADPSSAAARQGLEQVNALIAGRDGGMAVASRLGAVLHR
jgi:Tfp pilus assembly protein PilF